MALTEFQRRICRVIAANRIAEGESYVAGGVALNELIAAPRLSRDIDLFHDTAQAVETTSLADRALLETHGYQLTVVRDRPGFVEAEVSVGSERCLLQWARDSAFRFFPLLQHDEFGLTLHPFDLATNKVLALVGRLEVRDWIDVMQCDEHIQPLGYLAWAACGKDPGFSPAAILEEAGRTARYSQAEVDTLAFDGEPPDASVLSRRWHAALAAAHDLVAALPPEGIGKCVLDAHGTLFRGNLDEVTRALVRGEIVFHPGCIRGALPQLLAIAT